MKQRRLSLSLLILIAFYGLVLRFPSAQAAAAETSVPTATPTAIGAAGISPTPPPTEIPRVRWVGVHDRKEQRDGVWETYAQRGDKIWVDIVNFKDWVNKLEKKPDDHEWKDLILYLNHIPLDGVSPIY